MDGYSQKKIMINNFADNGGPFIEDRTGLLFFFAHFRTCVVNKKKRTTSNGEP